MSENNIDDNKVDKLSGAETTGHEWDGIRELNLPAPRWWLIIFLITIVWAIGYWIIYPTWPTIKDHTKGLISWSSKQQLFEQQDEIVKIRSKYLQQFRNSSFQDILHDKSLKEFAVAGGSALFKENCAVCHGQDATGGNGFPNLVDDDWLWGGKIEHIYYTIEYGIRSNNPNTRDSQMTAFGKDGILTRDQIAKVAQYTMSLSKKADNNSEGAKIFAENCAVCHGANGEGNQDVGAPRLNDNIWLFGSDMETIFSVINNSRSGVMPHWVDRLSDDDIRQLAIYVYSLGGGVEE